MNPLGSGHENIETVPAAAVQPTTTTTTTMSETDNNAAREEEEDNEGDVHNSNPNLGPSNSISDISSVIPLNAIPLHNFSLIGNSHNNSNINARAGIFTISGAQNGTGHRLLNGFAVNGNSNGAGDSNSNSRSIGQNAPLTAATTTTTAATSSHMRLYPFERLEDAYDDVSQHISQADSSAQIMPHRSASGIGIGGGAGGRGERPRRRRAGHNRRSAIPKNQMRRSLKTMNKFLRKTVYTLKRIKSLILQQVQIARALHLGAQLTM